MTTNPNFYPIEPYAYIRFSNERITIKESLNSILPFFKKGILCYHPPLPGIEEDGSLAIAEQFVKENPGFKLVKYPFPVVYQNSTDLANLEGISIYSLLHAFYAYALIHLKYHILDQGDYRRAWIMKIDLDHIYSYHALDYLLRKAEVIAQDDEDWCSLFSYKFNVRVKDGEPYFQKMENGLDHFFIKANHLKSFDYVYIKHEDWTLGSKLDFGSYERATFKKNSNHYGGEFFLNSIHFSGEKHLHYNKIPLEDYLIDSVPYSEISDEKVLAMPEMSLHHFSTQNLKEIIAKLDYPQEEDLHKYGRKNADFEKFRSDPQYHPTTIIQELNRRFKDESLTGKERAEVDREYKVFQRLVSKGLGEFRHFNRY